MCEYQSWYMPFAAGCGFYLNLLIAHEVFRLLSATKRIEADIPPSRRVAVLRCPLHGRHASVRPHQLDGPLARPSA
jgi:hypothetical protein